MRSFRLTTALAAAATLLALAPASALAAHKQRHAATPTGPCKARLNVAPRLIYTGGSPLAWGRLSCPGHEDASKPVTLYRYTVGSPPGFEAIGTTTTNPLGGYSLSVGALTSNTYFYAVVGGVRSATRKVGVVASVTLNGPTEGVLPAGLETGKPNNTKYRFTGSVSPKDAYARVVLQRQNALTGDEWHRIGAGYANKNGEFTIPHVFVVPGDANIRVLVRSSHRNVASPSNELNYEISQAQNPKLTIESVSDPSPYPTPVTIHGTTAPNTLLTLMARNVHQTPFTPVSQVKSNEKGEYTFPAQVPVESTFYEAQGGGQTSAVLFQGVNVVLSDVTMSPAVSSIPATETLTFSGSVSPDRAGHSIYLESMDAAGKFHVVQKAEIGSASTFSIVHYVYSEGTNVFRVRVPGDPQNGGAVSQTFTVQVTPPPAAAGLTPEPPGNSSLPSEGQL